MKSVKHNRAFLMEGFRRNEVLLRTITTTVDEEQ